MPPIVRFSSCLLFLTMFYMSQARSSTCESEFIPAQGGHEFLDDTPKLPKIDAVIGKVHITRLPIFNETDPKENNWLFRAANRFHVLTKESNITQQLLFKSGEHFQPGTVEESARLLRELDHLYDAAIRVVNQCDDKVDLEVITRDVWSLNLDLSLDRSGGESSHRLGISEGNLFGTGKQIAIINRKDTDRDSLEILYKDNNIRGSRIRGNISYANNDDGSNKLIKVGLPFIALSSPRAWEVRLQRGEQTDTQYFHGNDISEIDHEFESHSVHYGISSGLHKGVTRRWLFGYRYRKSIFSPGTDLPQPAVNPLEKELSYPFLQYEAVEDNFTTIFNHDQIHRTEDLQLGYFIRANLGYAASAFGSNLNRIITEGEYSNTLLYDKKSLLRHVFTWHAIWNQKYRLSEDVILDYEIKYFKSQTKKRSFFARLNAIWTENLNSNQQVVLGGATGVRGFDKRIQVGDKRLVLSLEERQYTNYHLFNLAYVGYAAFIDIGRAWQSGTDDGLEDKLLADIGFGIRLASSKADAGRIMHIDFALPLTNRDDPDIDNFLVALKVKNSL